MLSFLIGGNPMSLRGISLHALQAEQDWINLVSQLEVVTAHLIFTMRSKLEGNLKFVRFILTQSPLLKCVLIPSLILTKTPTMSTIVSKQNTSKNLNVSMTLPRNNWMNTKDNRIRFWRKLT
jgi:hypothetical protein